MLRYEGESGRLLGVSFILAVDGVGLETLVFVAGTDTFVALVRGFLKVLGAAAEKARPELYLGLYFFCRRAFRGWIWLCGCFEERYG